MIFLVSNISQLCLFYTENCQNFIYLSKPTAIHQKKAGLICLIFSELTYI